MASRQVSRALFLLAFAACGDPTRPLDANTPADAGDTLDASGSDRGPSDIPPAENATAPDSGPGRDTGGNDHASVDAGGPLCSGSACTEIGSLPFIDSDDTSTSSRDVFDRYGCGPQNESGPEHLYPLRLSRAGTLIAMLDDGSDVGADTDIHLLDALQAERCLARGHIGLSAHLGAGTYYLVVDSFVSSGGDELAGPYTLYVHFLADDSNCAMGSAPVARIGADQDLAMPATGPVVKEAHLVTDQEFNDGSWPTSIDDGTAAHYALSENTTGYHMSRGEPWAPCCEPSNEYGQGSSARPPVAAEAFYLNMRWASAPPRGQRYLVYNGKTGAAVVAAAGYENGPGDLSRVGGASEEIHDHLGSGHLDVLTFGLAVDQSLSYGPIVCRE